MTEQLITGAVCGAAAFLICNVLTAHGMILNFVPRWYWKNFAGRGWAEWIAKPLFDCPVCQSFWLVLVHGIIMEGGPTFHSVVASLLTAFILDRKYGENH